MSDAGRSPSAPRTTRASVWLLVVSPSLWLLHLLVSYGTAAVWCARFAEGSTDVTPVRVAIALYTAVALLAIGLTGRVGYTMHTHEGKAPPHDDDSPEDRQRFIGFATLLLSGLSAAAVIYATMAPAFIGSCH